MSQVVEDFGKIALDAAKKGVSPEAIQASRDDYFNTQIAPQMGDAPDNVKAMVKQRFNIQSDALIKSSLDSVSAVNKKLNEANADPIAEARAQQKSDADYGGLGLYMNAGKAAATDVGVALGKGVLGVGASGTTFISDIDTADKVIGKDNLNSATNYLHQKQDDLNQQASLGYQQATGGRAFAQSLAESVPSVVVSMLTGRGLAGIAQAAGASAKVVGLAGAVGGIAGEYPQNYAEARGQTISAINEIDPATGKFKISDTTLAANAPEYQQFYDDAFQKSGDAQYAANVARANTVDVIAERTAGIAAKAMQVVAPAGGVAGRVGVRSVAGSALEDMLPKIFKLTPSLTAASAQAAIRQSEKTGLKKFVPQLSLGGIRAPVMEGIEEGTQTALEGLATENAKVDAGGAPVDYGKIAGNAVSDALAGSVMGGGMHLASGSTQSHTMNSINDVIDANKQLTSKLTTTQTIADRLTAKANAKTITPEEQTQLDGISAALPVLQQQQKIASAKLVELGLNADGTIQTPAEAARAKALAQMANEQAQQMGAPKPAQAPTPKRPVLALPAPTITVDSQGQAKTTADQNADIQAANEKTKGNINDITPIPESGQPSVDLATRIAEQGRQIDAAIAGAKEQHAQLQARADALRNSVDEAGNPALASEIDQIDAAQKDIQDHIDMLHGVRDEVSKMQYEAEPDQTEKAALNLAHHIRNGRIPTLTDPAKIEASQKNPNYNVTVDENGTASLIGIKTKSGWVGTAPTSKAPTAKKKAKPIKSPQAVQTDVAETAAASNPSDAPTTKTENDFKDPDTNYRVIHGDEAFNDLVESGVVRTNHDTKAKADIKAGVQNRPTKFPSFRRGEAAMDYANSNPNNYVIETRDTSVKQSTSGRHGSGKTMFPTDDNGNHLDALDGSKVRVYKHVGDGKYELVYDQGKVIEPSKKKPAPAPTPAPAASSAKPTGESTPSPIQDGDVVRHNGEPFRSENGAQSIINKQGLQDTHEIVRLGKKAEFVVRPKSLPASPTPTPKEPEQTSGKPEYLPKNIGMSAGSQQAESDNRVGFNPEIGLIPQSDVSQMQSNEHIVVSAHAIGQTSVSVKFPEGAEYGDLDLFRKDEKGNGTDKIGIARFAKNGTYTITNPHTNEVVEQGKFDANNYVSSIKSVLDKFGVQHPAVDSLTGKPLSDHQKNRIKAKNDQQAESRQTSQQYYASPANEKLPIHLTHAKPRFAQHELNFGSDIDKAAYITAQETPSKADAEYMDFVKSATGLDDAAVRAHGRKVKAEIKLKAATQKDGAINVPKQEIDQPTTSQGIAAPAAPKQSAPKQSAPKQSAPKQSKKAEADAHEKALSDYFTPGNIVKSYGGGYDRVISRKDSDQHGQHSITVQEVKKQDGEWVDVGQPRTHSTQPDARNLKDGPVERAPIDDLAKYHENAAKAEPAAVDPLFAKNKLVSADAAAAAMARIKAKMGRLHSGIDPLLMADGALVAAAYIEAGIRSFPDFASRMIEAAGDAIKPHLMSFWEGARYYHGLDTTGMTSTEDSLKHFQEINRVVPEAVKAVIGEKAKVTGKRERPTGKPTDKTLRQDWGIKHIDGFAESPEFPNAEETDHGLSGGVKDAFLKDTAAYLKQVQTVLDADGYVMHEGTKKAINANAAGAGVSGEVSLALTNPEVGKNIYVKIGASSLSGMIPATKSGVSIMFRVGNKADGEYLTGMRAMNQWAPVSLTASEFASMLKTAADRVQGQTTIESPVNKAQSESNAKQGQSNEPEGNSSQSPAILGEPLSEGKPAAQGQGAVGVGSNGRSQADNAGNGNANAVQNVGSGSVAAGEQAVGVQRPTKSLTPDLFGDESKPDTTETITQPDGGVISLQEAADANKETVDGEPHVQIKQGDNPGNYRITEADKIGTGTDGERLKNNIAAIRLVRQLQAENRYATRDEQAILAKYVGWGGLANAFDANHSSKQFRDANAALKELLSDAEYKEALLSTRNAHYTSPKVIEAMYSALRHFGFDGGNVLEPTVGVGNFIGLMPDDFAASSKWYASELDPITGHIAQFLYPDAEIMAATGFQDANFANGKFDVAIGNPPFGDVRVTDRNKSRKDLSGMKIHNYVIAKAGLHLRAGGVMAMVVTHRFLDTKNDEARAELTKNFRFMGALRLPNTAFKENAKTEVTTDIIFLQKLKAGETEKGDQSWLDTNGLVSAPDGEDVRVNGYFAKNPSMMLGLPTLEGTMYGAGRDDEFTLIPDSEIPDLSAAIADRLKTVMASEKDVMAMTTEYREAAAAGSMVNRGDVGVGGFYMDGDKLMQRSPDDDLGNPVFQELTAETQWTEKTKLGSKLGRIKGMLGLRKGTQELIALEQADAPAKLLESARKALNADYDAFVKDYGFISDPTNSRLMDSDIGLESGLERGYKKAITAARAKVLKVQARPASAAKADLLLTRVFTPHVAPTKASNAHDAYLISLSERGKLDVPYIASLLGKTNAEVISELSSGETPMIFKDPATGQWQQHDEYLSGNVKQKYAEAQAAGMDKNAEALKKAFPKDVAPEDLHIGLRSTWLPVSDYEKFLEMLGYTNPRVTINKLTGSVNINVSQHTPNIISEDFKSKYLSPAQLIDELANGRTPQAKDRVSDGNGGYTNVVNKEATSILAGYATKIKVLFTDWMKLDADRMTEAAKAFNLLMNTHSQRNYDGAKHLVTVGANPSIKLRNTQKNAAWRAIQTDVNLFDHVVGAGKTFTIITAIMERRRLGLSKKPFVAVPNHLVGQWARDFYALYPAARVLAVSEKDFARANRQRLFARIATGNFDAIIVGHSMLKFIELRPETEASIIGDEMKYLHAALDQARDDGDKRTVKRVANQIDKKEQRFKALNDAPKDKLVRWEDMGIDYLAVDEAHEFKNLEYSTAMQTVVGMNDPKGSQRAFDLYLKIRALRSSGGAVNFATGTPISNSLVEMYTVLRYLNREGLLSRGQDVFDAWLGAYGEVESRIEYTATQKLKARNVLSRFGNLPELLQLYNEVADSITMDDLKRIYAEQIEAENKENGTKESTKFPVPAVIGGGRKLDVGDLTKEQSEYMDYLVARAEQIEKNGRDHDPKIDNLLWISNDARKMSLDMRLVDPQAGDDPSNKVNRAAGRIKALYDKWHDQKGTQLVFCDLSTPKKGAGKEAEKIIKAAIDTLGLKDDRRMTARMEDAGYEDKWAMIMVAAEQMVDSENTDPAKRDRVSDWLEKLDTDIDGVMATADSGFSVYDALKQRLEELGIPDNQIAFIHDFNTKDAKSELFDMGNDGTVRVVLGSSQKMGAGTNIQRRLVGLHHMDAPWRPSDVEQREGRIIRQGNMLYEQDPDGFEVEITAYSTSRTFDTVMWQTLERKAAMIEQFRSGEREMVSPDGDAAGYAEFMAQSTGNPAFRRKIEIEGELKQLQSAKRQFNARQYEARAFMESISGKLERAKAKIEELSDLEKPIDTGILFGKSYKNDYATELEKENDVYDAEYEEYRKKRDAFDDAMLEYTKLDADEKLTAKKPSQPQKPALVTIDSKRMVEHSDWSKMAETALEKADENGKVTVMINGKPLTIEQIDKRWFATYGDLEISESGSQTPYSEAMRQALDPAYIARAVTREKKHIQKRLDSLQNSTPIHEDMLKRTFADDKKLSDMTAEYEVVKKEVDAAADAEAARRAQSVNKYIMADDTRGLSQVMDADAVRASKGNAGLGMAKSHVENIVSNIIDKMAAAVGAKTADGLPFGYEVVQSFENLPQNMQASLTAEDEGIGQSLHGAYDIKNKKVYIIAGNVTDESQVQQVLFHEIYGHVGVHSLMGAEVSQKLRALVNSIGGMGGLAAIAAKNGIDLSHYNQGFADAGMSKAERNEAMMDELLAHLAQSHKNTIKERVKAYIGAVRAWLRSTGFVSLADMGETDLYHILAQARVAAFKSGQSSILNGIRASKSAPLTAGQRDLVDELKARSLSVLNWAEYAGKSTKDGLSKRLNTMLHKAETNPQFKPVFDLIQQKINHVASEAYDALTKAPELLGHTESLDDVKRDLKRLAPSLPSIERGKAGDGYVFSNFAKAKSDVAAAARAIFEGTLTGKQVYTDAELRSQFKLTPEQVKIYRDSRAAIDTSLDNVAKATLSKIAHAHGVPWAVIHTMHDQDFELNKHYAELKRMMTPENEAESAVAMRAVIEQSAKLQKEGYAPLMRFGNYYARIVDKNRPDQVSFRQHFETERQRDAFVKKLESTLPADQVMETGVLNPDESRMFKGISPETIALFAKVSGLAQDAATQAYLKTATVNHSALRRLIHRQGIEGYSEDLQRVLAGFVMSNARHSASTLFSPSIAEAVTNIKDGNLRQEAQALKEYVEEPREELQRLKNIMFIYNMGASVMFALVNLTQPLLQTIPWLAQYTPKGVSSTRLVMKAMKLAATSLWSGTTPEAYRAEFERAQREGHIEAANVFMLQGIEQGGSGLSSSYWKSLSHALGLNAQYSEMMNRRTTLFAALDSARAMPAGKLKELGFDSPYDYAVKAIQQTQGVYNKGNRPAWARGTGALGNFGVVMMLYKQFSINYVEMLYRMAKNPVYGGEKDKLRKAFWLAIAMIFATAGFTGLPFMQDMMDVAQTAAGAAGHPVNIERQVQLAIGKEPADFIMNGAINKISPMDFKSRMSMGNMIPATAYFDTSISDRDRQQQLFEIAGSVGSLAGRFADSVTLAEQGQPIDALSNVLPKFLDSIGKATQMATTGTYRNNQNQKITDATPFEAAMKAVDMQPARIAHEQRDRSITRRDVAIQAAVKNRFTSQFTAAVQDNDTAKVNLLHKQLDAWNENNPLYPVTIKDSTIEKRAEKNKLGYKERAKTPKGMEWMKEFDDK